jgi:hypothetical protein
MAHVGRLAGALLVETEGDFWLVGNTKEPCEWRMHGFEPPAEMDPTVQPYVRLRCVGEANVGEPYVVVDAEGEKVAQELGRRLLIERNASVSERLWRLVLGTDEGAIAKEIPAPWLIEVPEPVWRLVRDAVLRCL